MSDRWKKYCKIKRFAKELDFFEIYDTIKQEGRQKRRKKVL